MTMNLIKQRARRSIWPHGDVRKYQMRLLGPLLVTTIAALTGACSESAPTKTVTGILKSCDEAKRCTYVYEDGSEAEVDFSNVDEVPRTIVDEVDAK